MSKRSEAIFNTAAIARVDDALVESLKARAAAQPDVVFRYCLHRSVQEPVQQMVLVHRRHAYVPPHKHERATESFCVLEGRMLVAFFDAAGHVAECFEMAAKGSGSCFLCRAEKGRWHTMLPLTEFVVFLETTEGPFASESHNTFARWAPAEDDTAGIDAFRNKLLAARR